MGFELPQLLNYTDAFKMLEDKPANIKITQFEIYTEGDFTEFDNVLRLEYIFTDTNQRAWYLFPLRRPGIHTKNKYYIGFDHELYELFSYVSGIKDNAILVSKNDLASMVGLELKVTVKTSKNKIRPGEKLRRFLKCNIIPVTENCMK